MRRWRFGVFSVLLLWSECRVRLRFDASSVFVSSDTGVLDLDAPSFSDFSERVLPRVLEPPARTKQQQTTGY